MRGMRLDGLLVGRGLNTLALPLPVDNYLGNLLTPCAHLGLVVEECCTLSGVQQHRRSRQCHLRPPSYDIIVASRLLLR